MGDRAAVIELVHRRVPQVPKQRVAALLDRRDMTPRVDVVGARGRGVLGWGSTVQREGLPALLFGRVVVCDAEAGRGWGSRLHDRLLSDLPGEARQLRGIVIDTDEHALAVAAHWGYQPFELCHVSRFDLDGQPEPRRIGGVRFQACSRLRFPDVDAVTGMLDRAETNPERAHGMFLTLDMIRGFSAPGSPIGFLARVGGQPVGLIHGQQTGDQLLISFLCVDPEFRGRGIALALKERFHRAGKRLGATHVLTGNEDANTPVRTLNARMGYRRLHGEVRVQRPLA